MMDEKENELLTRTGPGTPCGDLMRRYWQPAVLSEELPLGGAPLPIRLRGEDLVINGRGSAPSVEKADAALTPYGVRSFKIRRDFGPDQYQLYLTEFVLPNLTAFPGPARGEGGYGVKWHVPIDDTHHWKYSFLFLRNGAVDPASWGRSSTRDETYHAVRNKADRYLQDRESMKTECYTGGGFDFSMHDLWATESEGPIQDRTNEHLGAMDVAVVAAHKVLTKAILDLQEGRESANITRGDAAERLRIVACNGVFPNSKTWKQVAEELEQEVMVW